MSEKRKRTAESFHRGRDEPDKKKRKRGFVVGPDNLPDGTYKRKADKIKRSLIERAQIKKEYAKLKRQGKIPEEREELPVPASAVLDRARKGLDEDGSSDEDDKTEDDHAEPTTAPHPERQTMIEKADDPPQEVAEPPVARKDKIQRKPKPAPFQREYDQAQQRKAEAEERRRAREEAERQRQSKLEERERFRRAMAKARSGGPNGQRKLGRESKVLLERVKRMVGDGG
ncbi:uncharacterized protein LTR77_000704 [Saxophila tyrrhenica]|uniref:rRNA-processing protein FYV7 n=1 Tax=Saxophila tyrrhenica TaxID=1690608 RepID=A0AAV9PTA5_9PEZI|nr:hypothetical protein LTR77_000704 [Saxophila tyrrhenica]